MQIINGIQLITDDTEAKAFLASENMLQNLQPIDPFDHVSAAFGTDEAYCLATLDTGHPNPEDNGYTVVIIPHDIMSPEMAAHVLHDIAQAGKLYPDCEQVTQELVSNPEFN